MKVLYYKGSLLCVFCAVKVTCSVCARARVCVLQGAASEDGRLKRGDQIMAVNGQSLDGVTHEEAVGILKRTKGSVTLTVLS